MSEIRQATPADLSAICALGEEVNAIHHAAFPSVFAGRGTPDASASHWMSSIAQVNATTLVAEEKGVLLGFVTVSVSDESNPLMQPVRVGRVGTIGVTEAARRGGIGSELMRHAEAWLMSRGAKEVRLNVWQFNTDALRLYQGLGYEARSVQLGKWLHSEA
jgi:ribosomal protein S18 acetylase RimI-like enzyme